MSENIASIVNTLVAAFFGGGFGAFVMWWYSRREQKRLLAAQAEKANAETGKTKAEAANIEAVTANNLQARIFKLESDARDRMAEMAMLYETLMSAIAHNRTLEAERARLLRFLRARYPDVYRAYCEEYGNGDLEGE